MSVKKNTNCINTGFPQRLFCANFWMHKQKKLHNFHHTYISFPKLLTKSIHYHNSVTSHNVSMKSLYVQYKQFLQLRPSCILLQCYDRKGISGRIHTATFMLKDIYKFFFTLYIGILLEN